MPARSTEQFRLQTFPAASRSPRARSVAEDVQFLYWLRGIPDGLPRQSDYFGVVTDVHDQVVGAVHAHSPGDRVWLDRLAVARSVEGCGVGAALLREVVTALAPEPHELVELSPAETARPFYARMGFDYSETSSIPGVHEVWFTQAEVLTGVLAQRATAGKLAQFTADAGGD